MDRYVTSTELKQRLKQTKQYARMAPVHVLDHGHEGFVLCSVEIYETLLQQARQSATWEAEAREACREGLCDQSVGNTVNADKVICLEYDGRNNQPIRFASTAAHDTQSALNAMDEAVLAQTLNRIGTDPRYGMSVDLEGMPEGIRKVLVPPYDILYLWEEQRECVCILGLVLEG